jgi:DNA-binding IclR family transcriptional regulator
MGTVEKAFQVIEQVVSHQGKGLLFSDVVSKTALPKATTHRILKSLVRLGYLRFEEETGRYFGDLKLSFLGSEVTSHFDLKRYIRPHLLRLQAGTKHTCHLGIRDGTVGVYLDKIESSRAFGIKLFSEVGRSFPLHCTGMGKALLAFLDPEQRKEILSGRLEVFTPNTIADPTKLERELKRIRSCGYAVDREEITRGIMCVAAPIMNGEGEVLAAVSVTFPAYIDKDRGIAQEIKAVTGCASTITGLLQEREARAGRR